MKHSISIQEVVERLSKQGTVVVDCRFALGQPQSGRLAYEAGHLPNAFYLDLEEDLSGPKDEHGGRHPLPDVQQLALKLGVIGIDASKVVIAYDDQGGAIASRLWWLLKYIGHEQVFVMNPGYSAWVKHGHPVTVELPEVEGTVYEPQVKADLVVSMDEVRARLGSPELVLVDSREVPRYKGLTEPIDTIAGHIPGAVNYFWKDGLAEDGTWKSAEQQAERFVALPKERELIVYCGSGVTACPNVMALEEAGYERVRLYAGSWSDWVSYGDNPVAVGEKEEV